MGVIKSIFGLQPLNVQRRLLIGSLFIFVAGFVIFATVFYSFSFAMQAVALLCVFPQGTAENLVIEIFLFPIILMGCYMGLVAAVLYYVNPWSKK